MSSFDPLSSPTFSEVFKGLTPSEPLSILITGGSGFVGRHLAKHLSSRGHRLTSLGRNNLKEVDAKIWTHSLIADFNSKFSIPDLSDFDCVIHLAGHAHSNKSNLRSGHTTKLAQQEADLHNQLNFVATDQLVRKAVADKVTEFVFLSSIAVYGDPQPYRANQAPIVWTEKSPTTPTTHYGTAKKHAEESIKAVCGDSTSYTIFRPTLIYGPDAPGNFALLKKLLRTRLPLPLKNFQNNRSFLSIDNLCSAITACVESEKGTNQTFNISDSDIVSTSQFITWMAEAAGYRSPIIPAPTTLMRTITSLLGQEERLNKLTSNCVVDSTKLRTTLNWSPPYSTHEAIRRSMN